MHIPMEILSFSTTRTDSAAGVNRATGPGARAGPTTSPGERNKFNSVFEQQLNRHDQKMLRNQQNPENADADKDIEKEEPIYVKRKPEQADEDANALAAGVQHLDFRDEGIQQQEVVNILEGEESVATPTVHAENTTKEPTITPQEPIITQKEPQITQIPIENETYEFAEILQDKVTQQNDGAQTAMHVQNPETTEKKDTQTVVTDTVIQTETEGEVTARMPIRSEEGNANRQSGQNNGNDGNPGPLENVNEQAAVKGQEDAAYTKAAQAAINKAENKTDSKPDGKPAEITAPETNQTPPPLSMGIKPEQFKANELMRQEAFSQPVRPENLFEEMISRVETMHSESKSTMTIQLNPEYLGKVALEVALDSTGLHVKIKADDSNVRGQINSQLTTLIESLQNKGIAVSEVEVVFAGANFDNNFTSQGDGRQEQESRSHTRKDSTRTAGSVEYYTTITDLMDYYLAAGISSVEYSA